VYGRAIFLGIFQPCDENATKERGSEKSFEQKDYYLAYVDTIKVQLGNSKL
jgi:hypothetical protein